MTEPKLAPIIHLTVSNTLLDKPNHLMIAHYDASMLEQIVSISLVYMDDLISKRTCSNFPNFKTIRPSLWLSKPKELEVYLTDIKEGKALNEEARGKDYATNILSYPSELPSFVLEEMPTIPLGELIICHDIVVGEAKEQNKSLSEHTAHLLVHGILHLLGFDHELGQYQQDEMEGFEIAILKNLGIENPYIAR